MPQRFLRPGIRTSGSWNSVSRDAQVLFIGILTLVDDFGRYDGRASVLCGECFSVWNELHQDDAVNPQRTAALSCELQDKGLVLFYESDGKKVLQVTQWQERARSDRSKWPPPQESAAERSGILPPSPLVLDHTPLAIAIDHTPAPCVNGNGDLVRQIKTEIGEHFGRKIDDRWSYEEEYELVQVCKSPTVVDEWSTIRSYRASHPEFQRATVLTLLRNWGGELDKARQIGKRKKYVCPPDLLRDSTNTPRTGA